MYGIFYTELGIFGKRCLHAASWLLLCMSLFPVTWYFGFIYFEVIFFVLRDRHANLSNKEQPSLIKYCNL